MHNKFYLSLSFVFVFFVSVAASVDDDWLTLLLTKLDNVRVKYPQEKVHLHTDRSYFTVGDDIWFKAYVVNSENNELSALSKVLYVDLLNDRDSVCKTQAVQLANGLGNGSITLVDSLYAAGNYHLRAYTRWMQNFGADNAFDKEITIGDTRKNAAITAASGFKTTPGGISADITYTTLADGSAISERTVTYRVYSKNKVIASGKSKTDASGKALFNISLKEQYRNEPLSLETQILLPAGYVKRNFDVKLQDGRPDVQFFPEGGKMIFGLRSKVAFKAVGPGGVGLDVQGTIVDQNNNPVAEFTSAHAGMGVFAMIPAAGITYTAVINGPAGTQYRYTLPAADAEGYVLGINHLGNDSLSIRVAASSSFAGRETALIALQNGVVKYTSKIRSNQSVINALIPEARFSTGLVQFTLLSADAMPLAERIVFVNHHDQLKVSLTTGKANYGKREKVEMQVSAKDAAGKPVEGNFLVAVINKSKAPDNDDDDKNIYTDLLLASDLKGYIEKPNYYFTSDDADHVRHLDNLLLTQGWRRFKWADIKGGTLPAITYQPQASLAVSGMITSFGGKPIPNGKVTLFANTPQGVILTDTVADVNGRFTFEGLEFNDDVKFVVRAKNAKDKNNVKIVLDDPLQAPLPFRDHRPDLLSAENTISFLQSNQQDREKLYKGQLGNSIMLNEVKIRQRTWVDKNAIKGSAKLGGGTPDIVIKKERLQQYSNIMFVFSALAGIEVRNNMVYRVGRVTSLTRPDGEPMLVLVDGVAIMPDMLKDIPPSDIEGIEVLKSSSNTAIYGNDGYWGVLVVTLKRGAAFGYTPPAYIGVVKATGYVADREFYSPAYDVPSDTDKQPDLRTTIFWQPNVVTAADGTAKLSYYTSDEPGTYQVITEGINIDGKLARNVSSYTVR